MPGIRFHVVYLHTKAVRTQFTEAFAEMPRIEYFEREHGDFYTNIRRVGDIVWIRIHDQMLPTVLPRTAVIFRSRSNPCISAAAGLSRWITPIDDTRTMVIAWRHFPRRSARRSASGLTNREEVGFGKTDFYGQSADRALRAASARSRRLRCLGYRRDQSISTNGNTLGFRPTGVSSLCVANAGCASQIRKVREGGTVKHPTDIFENPIPTYGGDTMLRIPPQAARMTMVPCWPRCPARWQKSIVRTTRFQGGRPRADKLRQALQEYEASFA